MLDNTALPDLCPAAVPETITAIPHAETLHTPYSATLDPSGNALSQRAISTSIPRVVGCRVPGSNVTYRAQQRHRFLTAPIFLLQHICKEPFEVPLRKPTPPHQAVLTIFPLVSVRVPPKDTCNKNFWIQLKEKCGRKQLPTVILNAIATCPLFRCVSAV